MKISVVTPTFRRPVELAEALTSVLSQGDVTADIIVVDDCPEGSAQPVVAGFTDGRVRYLRNPNPSNGRPAVVRNLGWPLATADLVHFLDDDDHVPSGHYRQVVEEFASHPHIGVVFGEVEPFGTDPSQVADERAYFACARRAARVCRQFGPRFAFSARQLCGQTLLVCGAAIIRRACIAPLGGFDPAPALMEDVDFYGRAITRFGAFYTSRVTLRYRIGYSLMHRPDVSGPVLDAYRHMQARFRAEHGPLAYRARQATAKLIARIA